MNTFNDQMAELRKQLEKGEIQKAYKGLLDFIWSLKTYFNTRHPEYSSAGTLYHGYMDMTYFPLFPEALKRQNLKIAVVFNYAEFRFEIWLSGTNKGVQAEYWKRIKDSGWNKYRLIDPGKGIDSILEEVLAADPDFGDLEGLTNKIEIGTLKFIQDVEHFLDGKQ